MGLGDYLSLPFAQHALLAGGLVAVTCGLFGPFVITRNMAFAVHGTAELAFTGAAAGLLVSDNPVGGALIGSVVVAALIAALSSRQRDRDSSIGVVLAAGLGLGVLLLGYYHGFATQATNILFGNLFGVSTGQILLLVVIAVAAMVCLAVVYRPLLFASVDPEVAAARGVPVRVLGLVFLLILALTVTPAASAQRLATSPLGVAILSVVFAVLSADGGLLASLQASKVKPSVLVAAISFAIYLLARLAGPMAKQRARRSRAGADG